MFEPWMNSDIQIFDELSKFDVCNQLSQQMEKMYIHKM